MADGRQAGLIVFSAAAQGGVGVRRENGVRSFFFRRGGLYTCNLAGESGHVDVDRVDSPLAPGR